MRTAPIFGRVGDSMPSKARNPVVAFMRADRFASSIGVRLLEVREGYARASLRLRPEHLNGAGVAMGGAVFTLADLAFAAASNSRGQVAVGLDANITYARAAVGGTLTAEAREEAVSRRVSVCTVRVTDGEGQLVAIFRGTAFRKDEPVAALVARSRAPRRTRGGSPARRT